VAIVVMMVTVNTPEHAEMVATLRFVVMMATMVVVPEHEDGLRNALDAPY
jgi:hypothetical protein